MVDAAGPKAPLRLLGLPPEIFQQVVDRVPLANLPAFDQTCRGVRRYSENVYRDAYGTHFPSHLPVSNKDAFPYRALFLDRTRIEKRQGNTHVYWHVRNLDSDARAPETKRILELLTGGLRELTERDAARILVTLQKVDDVGSRDWNQAVAGALRLQGRVEAAQTYEMNAQVSSEPMSEESLLVATRFITAFEPAMPLENLSQDTVQLGLECAARNANVPLAKAFTAAGANKYEENVAKAAALSNDAGMLSYVLDRGPLHRRNTAAVYEAAYQAAINGKLAALRFLLKTYRRISRREVASKCSPFEWAVAGNEVAAAKLLYQYDPPFCANKSPLLMHLALLQKGEEPKLCAMLRYLATLPKGPTYVAQVDAQGRSALHHAAEAGLHRAVDTLLELGADPRLLDNGGQSAAEIASNKSHFTLAVALLRRFPDGHSDLFAQSRKKENAETVRCQETLSLLDRVACVRPEYCPGSTREERIASVAPTWCASPVQENLLAAYVLNFSGRTLDLWARSFDTPAFRARDAATALCNPPAADPCPPRAHRRRREPALPRNASDTQKACARIVADLFPHRPGLREMAARLEEHLSPQDIESLHAFLCSDEGVTFAQAYGNFSGGGGDGYRALSALWSELERPSYMSFWIGLPTLSDPTPME